MHNNTITKYIDAMFVHVSHGYKCLTINFSHDDSQTQHRPHTASLDFVVKTVSKNLNSNLLVRFNIWTHYGTVFHRT